MIDIDGMQYVKRDGPWLSVNDSTWIGTSTLTWESDLFTGIDLVQITASKFKSTNKRYSSGCKMSDKSAIVYRKLSYRLENRTSASYIRPS